ncbi:MAG: pyruvate dehydrogenase (acetyl-transferring) E1 component subunit alpha [Planctomycetes bacterium]|nr:pyruvate dehydrogenase (acetyl-transferring) E1 component subunit alpha [Planctomycetota bacterium]
MRVCALNAPRYTSSMPIQTVFKAEIERISILDEHNQFDEKLGAGLISDEDLVRLYEAMSSCRYLDEVAFKLQRSGRMGTYPQNMGQEATSLGAAYALNSDDWLVTCYRENCGLFWRGVPMESILLHWMGDERGNAMPAAHYATPIAVPIGTQMLHATGLAWASKYRGESRIACTFFGDGASSEGDFHEAANFAANLDIPVIFCCQSNSWAISVPQRIQCSAPTVAQRGMAYGMPCMQVDGNDIFACVYAVKAAAKRAREESRPTFIELVTYRLGDHTTADDARRYRDQAEVDLWKLRDPLIRTRKLLETKRLWDSSKEDAMRQRIEVSVNAAVARAEEIAAPPTSDVFDHTFAQLPPDLVRQRDSLQTHSLAGEQAVHTEGH